MVAQLTPILKATKNMQLVSPNLTSECDRFSRNGSHSYSALMLEARDSEAMPVWVSLEPQTCLAVPRDRLASDDVCRVTHMATHIGACTLCSWLEVFVEIICHGCNVLRSTLHNQGPVAFKVPLVFTKSCSSLSVN